MRLPIVQHRRTALSLILVVLVSLSVATAYWFSIRTHPVVLGLPMNTPENPTRSPQEGVWPGSAGWPASPYLALRFARERGIHPTSVEEKYRIAGRGAVASLVDGTVDAAWTFGPPVVTQIDAGADLLVLAVVMRSYGQSRIVARVANRDDWYTKRVAITPNTITDSMLIAQLSTMGKLEYLLDDRIEVTSMHTPENTFFSLIDGYVEAASMPGLYADFLMTERNGQPNPDFVDVSIREVYRMNGMLVSTPSAFEAKRDPMIDMIEIFKRYGEYVRAHADTVLPEMRHLEAAASAIEGGDRVNLSWTGDDFIVLTAKQEIRTILDNEARIRVAGKLMDAVPDFERALSELDAITAQLERR